MDLPQSISQLHKDLLAKKYSTVELVDAYLARINAFDKNLNSFITVTDEKAYNAAKKADKLIADLGEEAFKQFPLLGVVTAYKDLFLTKGVRTTAGSKVLESYIPQYSSTVVERLNNAGCIMIGKTNQDAWGHGSSGENSDYGPTRNPWNFDYVPGGSSSGSGAAVAADFAMLATGTDTGSSVRMPASFCNLVGLKPTYGVVSRYGTIAFASSLDTMGHITRTAEDNEVVFNITKGADFYDSTLAVGNANKDKEKFTIGLPKEYFIDGIDPEVKKVIDIAIKDLEQTGCEFTEISLPHTKYGVSVYYITAFAEASSNLGRYDGIRYGNDRSSFGDEAKRRIMLGSYVLSAGYYDAYYLKAMKVRSKIIEDFDNTYKKVDAILAPICPTPPFKLGEKTDDPLQMYLSDIFTASANLAGIPGLAVPAGFSKTGLPIGYQLMGPRFSEGVLYKIAKNYQDITDWHLKRPNLI